jgi:hypothetical protein
MVSVVASRGRGQTFQKVVFCPLGSLLPPMTKILAMALMVVILKNILECRASREE